VVNFTSADADTVGTKKLQQLRPDKAAGLANIPPRLLHEESEERRSVSEQSGGGRYLSQSCKDGT